MTRARPRLPNEPDYRELTPREQLQRTLEENNQRMKDWPEWMRGEALSPEDSERLLKDLEDRCSPEEARRRVARAKEILEELGVKKNSLRPELERLERELAHTREFYAVRWHTLRDLLVRKGAWEEACNILANCSASPTEPPTYPQLLHVEQARAAEAEERSRALEAELVQVRAALDRAVLLRDGSVTQCERIRRRWLKAEAELAKLRPDSKG